jgi:hypothetical protein
MISAIGWRMNSLSVENQKLNGIKYSMANHVYITNT